MALCKLASAVDAVGSADDCLHGEHHDGVIYQRRRTLCERIEGEGLWKVVGDVDENEGHSEFECGLENADVGVRVHPFVGDDEGVERHRHQLDYHHADRALIDPQRSNFALRRYVHVGFKEPQSEGLAKEQQECAENDLQEQGSGEDPLGGGAAGFSGWGVRLACGFGSEG